MDISLISLVNSSTTPLGVSGIFTGTFVDMTDYSSVSVMVNSNVPSATNGLKFQWSTDGVNIDDEQSYSYAGSVSEQGRFIYATVRAQFVRIRYTNGGSVQGVFRLQTLIRRGPVYSSISQLQFAPTNEDDTTSTHSLGYGRNISSPGTPIVFKTDNDATSLMVNHPLNRTTISERTIVASSAFSQQIDLFAIFGPTRRFIQIFNDTIVGALFLRLGGSASLTTFFWKIPPQHTWNLPLSWGKYSGGIHGIWDVADGSARSVEAF